MKHFTLYFQDLIRCIRTSCALLYHAVDADVVVVTLAQETDGSWEDISDEEREAETAALKAKGKMPMEGPVLEEIERQEAEMRAAAADVDTD